MMKLLGFVLLVIAVLALVAGLAAGETELLNPRRTQAEVEQIMLENERARADLAYQQQLRAIELEKQRQLAQREVEVYPQILQRRAETIEAVIIVVGGTLAAAVLVVSGVIALYFYKRASQLEVAGSRPPPVPGAALDQSRPRVAKNGDFVLAERVTGRRRGQLGGEG